MPSDSAELDELLSGRRVSLVGGAGFIGHHLALALSRLGADVQVVDGLTVNNLLSYAAMSRDSENRDLYLTIIHQRLAKLHDAGIPISVQDARDYDALSRILTKFAPQTVIHLAAVANAGRSNKDPQSTFGHSLRTLENALDYSRGNAEHFVYFSSSMVYGNFQQPEVGEDHPLDPIGIYAALKLAGEKIAIAYKQVFDLDYTIIRPSALYGPGCVSRRVSQVFIESALVGSKLRVDGEGEERVDFSYVDDVVDGVARAIALPAARNETFNVTAGRARTLAELTATVQEHFPEVEVEYVEREALRPYRGTLSIDKARRLLGYEPRWSLEEGLDAYVSWYRELAADGVLAGSS
jgi:nucleoside-diphosphate-sugar epimerase